jgi:hypothetical protein
MSDLLRQQGVDGDLECAKEKAPLAAHPKFRLLHLILLLLLVLQLLCLAAKAPYAAAAAAAQRDWQRHSQLLAAPSWVQMPQYCAKQDLMSYLTRGCCCCCCRCQLPAAAAAGQGAQLTAFPSPHLAMYVAQFASCLGC